MLVRTESNGKEMTNQVGKDGATQEHHVSPTWGVFDADLKFLENY